jgi:serine/threonine-protein kinase HipA
VELSIMAERLAVLLSGVLIGHLERRMAADDPTFTYAGDYVRDGAVALSAQLPIQANRHPENRVRPYLFGLLPENDDARAVWADRLGVDMNDAFGILASMGWDCPGAVQFCRDEDLDQLTQRAGDYEAASDPEIARRIGALAAGEPSWTMPDEHWSLGGQQGKFALARIAGHWHTAHGSAATTHIVKPGIRALHHQALVEHATMAAATALGIAVANTSFARFEDRWAIVVERFDRSLSDGRVVRIHQEDFAQACGRMPLHKHESRGGPQLRDMVRIVSRESTDLLGDRLALADFLIINLVSGAPDGHAKNISVRRAPEFTDVAPLYDLASGLAYDSRRLDRAVALSIGGERDVARIRRRQWEKAATLLGIEPELVIGRVADVAAGFPSAFEAELQRLGDGVPGVGQIAERSVPALHEYAGKLLDRL